MVEIDPNVFAETEEGTDEYVIVVGAADPLAAAHALYRAGHRFMMVAEDGHELTEDDDPEDLGDIYTPNYVSDVRMAPRGPWVYVDCKGNVVPPMRERMLAVLAEELEHAGIEARVEAPAHEERDYSVPPLLL